MQKLFLTFMLWAMCLSQVSAQFTRQDSLRGTITLERAWWDLVYYDLSMKVDPETRIIEGENKIYFRPLEQGRRIQIDLQEPMKIESITQDGKELKFEKDGNAWFAELERTQKELDFIVVKYAGAPRVSTNPPWSGGITWKEDSEGKPFIASSCQGAGASLWWPCKDHMYDEPDSMRLAVKVPEGLMDVSSGRLEKVTKHKDGWSTFQWLVRNPINNYGVSINIADYVHFSETYKGENGDLSCDYYVLRENLEAAREQFKQVPMMLEAFEYWFGPYPFYKDGFKLIEAPYLGMEHQSAVTYGNGYQNGYRGRDLSQSGWGEKFDFIIIHESGHEWFANNITYKDIADMWVHEGFTAYSENLYVDYFFGKEAAREYVVGTRMSIRNDRPIIGTYGVNKSGSGDMYSKGANLLHMIRTMVNDDEKWRQILRGLNERFYHQTVTSQQIEEYITTQSGLALGPVFDQYLRDERLPVLEYYFKDGHIFSRFMNAMGTFEMEVPISINGKNIVLHPGARWTKHETPVEEGPVIIPKDYYFGNFNILGTESEK